MLELAKKCVEKFDEEPIVKLWLGPYLIITTNKPSVTEVINFTHTEFIWFLIYAVYIF